VRSATSPSDYLVPLEHSELARYDASVAANPNQESWVNGVSDWEHREYFEPF
jgi:glutamine synthetase